MSKNTRIALVFGGFVTAVAAAFYPIFVYPLTHKNEYSKCQLSYKFSYTISLQWLPLMSCNICSVEFSTVLFPVIINLNVAVFCLNIS